jgi:hypothetical protein
MKQTNTKNERTGTRVAPAALAVGIAALAALPAASTAADTAALEARVAELTAELAQAQRELAAAREETAMARAEAERARDDVAAAEPAEEAAAPPASKIQLGPLAIGGAMRVNYILGDYPDLGDGPSRGGNGGNFELDTFRINLALDYGPLIGAAEYRWYDGYNFLHTGWLGWKLDEDTQLQAGVTRVPFGPGPYGVSQSWFFDQHYYVGLADDMDLGLKYVTSLGNWDLDLAWFYGSEGHWNGTSEDSARYSYDAVNWTSGLDAEGNVVAAPANGYRERNQFNLRTIYHFEDLAVPTDLGVSLQYGQLEGRRSDDGSHWAASVHMVNTLGNWKLATQLTRYEIDIDDDNPLGTDTLVSMGAYDFAWPVAAKAWIPAVSLSYRYDTPRIGWLDYVLPYVEYSNIIKDEDDFNDSQLFIVGAAWARGGWYIYTDLAWSNGNYFVGSDGDDYSNVFDGVGDFGANGNDAWNYRFNINFGYYF